MTEHIKAKAEFRSYIDDMTIWYKISKERKKFLNKEMREKLEEVMEYVKKRFSVC